MTKRIHVESNRYETNIEKNFIKSSDSLYKHNVFYFTNTTLSLKNTNFCFLFVSLSAIKVTLIGKILNHSTVNVLMDNKDSDTKDFLAYLFIGGKNGVVFKREMSDAIR